MSNDTSDTETEKTASEVVENKDTSEVKTVKKKRAAKKKVDSSGVEVQKKPRKKKAAEESYTDMKAALNPELDKYQVVCGDKADTTEITQEDMVVDIVIERHPNDVPVPEIIETFELEPEPEMPKKTVTKQKGSIFDIVRWRRRGR